MNVIKKNKLKKVKKAKIKPVGPFGDVLGVLNAYLKEGKVEDAECVALTLQFTMEELADHADELLYSFHKDAAYDVLLADLHKFANGFKEAAGKLSNL